MSTKTLGMVLPAAAAVFLTFALILYSEEGFKAALDGLRLFLDIVFPSLLPFFVLSEVMLGLGVVHFLGVIFEPLMRPVFNVPGVGAFVLSMGLAAGYPMDAVITAKFRKNNMCTKVEGERLLAFTNTADPLFIFGAVAVGMFNSPRLGMTLAAAHYLSAMAVGIIFRFYRRGSKPSEEVKGQGEGFILIRAYRALCKARVEDGRSLGKLLGDAVTDSVKTLLMIAGFIMFFSMLSRMLTIAGIDRWLGLPFAFAFRLLGISPELVPAALSGLLEIDIGTVAASQAAASWEQKVMMASAIIAWSGLSVHGQVASVLTGTDIGMVPYAIARLFHAVIAALLTLVFLGPAEPAVSALPVPAMSPSLMAARPGLLALAGFHLRVAVISLLVLWLVLAIARLGRSRAKA